MKKQLKFLVLALFGLAIFAAEAAVATEIPVLLQRCEEDSLSPTQAVGRYNWLRTHHPNTLLNILYQLVPSYTNAPESYQWKFIEENILELTIEDWSTGERVANPKPLYATFANSLQENPLNWFPPSSAGAAYEAIPDGYSVVGLCRSSCYDPETMIWFAEGRMSIAEATEKRTLSMMTLTADSTLNGVRFEANPVDHYTASIKDTNNMMVHITLESGKTLKVTENHPILRSNGVMVTADKLIVGNAMLTESGTTDKIVNLTRENFYGKVYNVAPSAQNLKKQIIVAEGYLVGSDWYQNEGINNINRKIVRMNVPSSLAE